MTRKISRRDAMKLAALAAAPAIIPWRVLYADAPSNMTNVASIGIGWQGGGNLGGFLGARGCKVIAVCDVDEGHLNEAAGKVNGHYKNSDCKTFKDFRELLQMKDLDAVAISTPDHWHSIPAIAAANAKKDIFCEKPLSHTLAEGIAMVEAVHRNERIWQTGSWQRSVPDFRRAAMMVANGYVGKVTRVEVGLPSGHADFAGTGGNSPDSEPPPGVDYDFWIGPAQMMPFNKSRFHKNWRWNYNTGGGQLMDWIGHHCDITHWGLSNPKYGCGPDDQVGPMELTATADFPSKDAVWNTATKFRIECKYPNGIDLVIAGGYGDIRGGAKWIGPNGWVSVDRGHFEFSDKGWLTDIREREKTKKDLEVVFFDSPGHIQEFVDSCKSRKRTLTPVAVAHRSQTPGHLGLIAARLGRALKWDAAKEEIVGDAEANKMLSKQMRPPWKIEPPVTVAKAEPKAAEKPAAKPAPQETVDLAPLTERLQKRVIAESAKGVKPDAALSLFGNRGARVMSADEKGLVVKSGGSSMTLPWKGLSKRDLLGLAEAFAKQDDAGDLEILAGLYRANGRGAKADEVLAKVALLK